MKGLINYIIGDNLKATALDAFNWAVGILPDLVGYSALATGIFVMLSSLSGHGIMKPLGVFAGVFVVSVSVLGAA
ncbi:hypothetical protein [Viridibacillus arvi]|uniref:hypothetical protein n=1 Tax=Viridibacillus arvi TaxID=263475 RepID=UPI0034CD179E